MCGIAGLALKPGAHVGIDTLRMLDKALAHRGPDGSGMYVNERVAFVHRRLAVVDVATGDQPLYGASSTLIANGEIYNNPELRKSLPDANFSTLSDCEPPLFLNREGTDIVLTLRGMFAIALDDSERGVVFLFRDPFGIKPLYVGQSASGLAFASEPQALIAAKLSPAAIDPQRLVELLHLQFCTGTTTVFPTISRLPPGSTVRLRDGVVESSTIHDPIELGDSPGNEEAALARLDAVLAESVEFHQRSDVPFGMFLSGGIDSATILAVMARINEQKVQAFTAGFDHPSVADERDAAENCARAVGARHERVEVNERMVWRYLPAIVSAMDDPVADPAIIPTWFLAKLARSSVKVVLSGEGGDELFAGYGRYRGAARPWPFVRPMRKNSPFAGLGVLRNENDQWRTGIDRTRGRVSGTKLTRAQREDIAEWLPNDLLLKLDRCLMTHGVEGRTPFLDREVGRFAFSLPDRLRARRGVGKYLLRLWLERHMPAARPFAPKQGFDVPIGAWIEARSAKLGDLVARAPIVEQLARPGTVKELFSHAGEKGAGVACWRLLFLAVWHGRYALGRPADGDVFDFLAEQGR